MVSPPRTRGYGPRVTFDVAADAYASFMGRFAAPLAEQFVDLVGIEPGSRVLDVGCGPGTVTAVLVDRLGADHVAAVDPSPSFVPAVRERLPDVDVREGAAEDLPFADASFDVAVAQLVVPFMADPVRGLSEMGRVVRVRRRRRRVRVGLRPRPGRDVLARGRGARPRRRGARSTCPVPARASSPS